MGLGLGPVPGNGEKREVASGTSFFRGCPGSASHVSIPSCRNRESVYPHSPFFSNNPRSISLSPSSGGGSSRAPQHACIMQPPHDVQHDPTPPHPLARPKSLDCVETRRISKWVKHEVVARFLPSSPPPVGRPGSTRN